MFSWKRKRATDQTLYKLKAVLNGLAVTINNKKAYVSFNSSPYLNTEQGGFRCSPLMLYHCMQPKTSKNYKKDKLPAKCNSQLHPYFYKLHLLLRQAT